MATRRVGELDVADHVSVLGDLRHDILAHDRHVIDVVFDAERRVAGAAHHIERLLGGRHQEVRPVLGVDCLDDGPHAGRLESIGRIGTVFRHGIEATLAAQLIDRRAAGEHVDGAGLEHLDIGQRLVDRTLEVVLSAGHCRDAGTVGRDVAGRKVDHRHVDAGFVLGGFEVGNRRVVREGDLDRAEAGALGRTEAREQRILLEHERNIGRKTRHNALPPDLILSLSKDEAGSHASTSSA